MKQHVFVALLTGALSSSSLAIMQVDVPADLFDPNCGPTAATMTTMDGVTLPATLIAGWDGFPPAYHLIFDYDAAPPASPVVTGFTLTAGSCTRAWNPPQFTVFYTPGPNFPIAGQFPPSHECCDPPVDADEQPVAFHLGAACPNPFNPSTTIGFTNPELQFLCLQVHDMRGGLVRTLVKGLVERGTHSVVFDAAGLPSGVYVTTLASSTHSASSRVLLLK